MNDVARRELVQQPLLLIDIHGLLLLRICEVILAQCLTIIILTFIFHLKEVIVDLRNVFLRLKGTTVFRLVFTRIRIHGFIIVAGCISHCLAPLWRLPLFFNVLQLDG